MKPPTLADEIYRMTFKPDMVAGWRSNVVMRDVLSGARRFVADDRMSAFIADLSFETYFKCLRQETLSTRILDSLRVQARLPHEAIWIEYSLRAYMRRRVEIEHQHFGKCTLDPTESPLREGWLIQQHPTLSTAYIMHLFTADDKPDDLGFTRWTFPWAFGWRCDEGPLPWEVIFSYDPKYVDKTTRASLFLLGYSTYVRENVDCVYSPLIVDPIRGPGWGDRYGDLMREWSGILRRVWALLATIDHLPVTYGAVRQSKGFLARGRIRKFYDHTTITLRIPERKDTRVIARSAIAHAHHKRHEVRGHWRNHYQFPPSPKCNPHLWEPLDDDADVIACAHCGGRQFYIHKHERGDASLGYVWHDYELKH